MIFSSLSTTSNISVGRKEKHHFHSTNLRWFQRWKSALDSLFFFEGQRHIARIHAPSRIVNATRTEITCKLTRKLASLSVSTQKKRRNPELDLKNKTRLTFVLSANTCVCLWTTRKRACIRFMFSTVDQKSHSHVQPSKNSNLMCFSRKIEHDSHFQHK